MQFLYFCLCYPPSKSCRVTCSFGAGTLAAPPLVDGSSGDPSLQWTWNTFHSGNVCSFCWCFSMSIDVCCWWWWRIWCIYIYTHIYVHLELMDLSLSRMTPTWIEEPAKRDHVKGCEDGSGGNTSKIELITSSFPARSSSTNERYWNLEGHWSFSQWCDFKKRFVHPDGSSMPF